MSTIPPIAMQVEHATAAAVLFDFPRAGGIRRALAEVEAAMIERALNACDGRKGKAAVRLGISRYALERRLVRIKTTLESQNQGG